MSSDERITGFNRAQEPKDRWAADLLSRYGLPVNASLEQIEEKATHLLSSPLTALSGAELVLGRRVDGNREREPDVVPIIGTPGLSGKEKFGLLLMQKGIEEAQAKEES